MAYAQAILEDLCKIYLIYWSTCLDMQCKMSLANWWNIKLLSQKNSRHKSLLQIYVTNILVFIYFLLILPTFFQMYDITEQQFSCKIYHDKVFYQSTCFTITPLTSNIKTPNTKANPVKKVTCHHPTSCSSPGI